MPTAHVNGTDIFYSLEGSQTRPVVTLSHSLMANHRMWDAQMPALRDYCVLRYDTRGHGASAAPEGPYTLDMLADDAIALLTELGIEKTVFCGLSMGGMTAQTFALKRPDLLRGLILCDTSSRYDAEAREQWQERIAAAEANGIESLVEGTIDRWFSPEFAADHGQEVDAVRAMIRSTPLAGYKGCAAAISQLDLTDRLHEIHVATLAIVGENDPGTPVSAHEVIADRIPSARPAGAAQGAPPLEYRGLHRLQHRATRLPDGALRRPQQGGGDVRVLTPERGRTLAECGPNRFRPIRPQPAAASAWSRSARMSSMCSRPMERRT